MKASPFKNIFPLRLSTKQHLFLTSHISKESWLAPLGIYDWENDLRYCNKRATMQNCSYQYAILDLIKLMLIWLSVCIEKPRFPVIIRLYSMRHILFIPHPENEKHLLSHVKEVSCDGLSLPISLVHVKYCWYVLYYVQWSTLPPSLHQLKGPKK